MTDFLKKIFAPQLKFEGVDQTEKLLKFFCDLYRIEIFKDGLDLILTRIKEGHLRFEVKIIQGWDTDVGHFLSEPKSFYDQTLGKFFQKRALKVTLRKISHNVMAHEMAHVLEHEGGIELGEDFRTAVGYDMKGREPKSIPLKAEIKRLMVDALKSYESSHFISELFARYFELLSVSRDVHGTGDFTSAEVMEFFENTTNFIKKIFNPQIQKKVDKEIAQGTAQIAAQVKLEAPQQKFQEKVESFHKRSESSWSKNVKSNAGWQVGWQKYQELEGKKDGDKK